MTKNEAVGYFNILSGASVSLVENKDERFKIYDFLMAIGKVQEDIMKSVQSARDTIKDETERKEYIDKMAAEDAGIEEIRLSKQTYYELIDSNKDKFTLGAINGLAKLMAIEAQK